MGWWDKLRQKVTDRREAKQFKHQLRSALPPVKQMFEDPELNDSQRRILKSLKEREGRPSSMSAIAKATNLNKRTVERQMKHLREMGLVDVAERSKLGNTYEVSGV